MKLFALLILALDPTTHGESAILMDAKTGHILYEKAALEERHPASITKILTTLIALEEKGNALGELVVTPRECVGSITPSEKQKANYQLPSHWIETASSHVGLKVGEELSLETLLYGVMLESGNDASNIVAHHVGGDIPTFVKAMNIRAQQLGCQKTHFTNPHGLHHPNHVTCAYDMALMTREAMRYPTFRKLAQAQYWKKEATNKQEATNWVQHNQLVRRGKKHYYSKAIGVKNGRTDAAGATLVGAAADGGRELIGVVLGCETVAGAYSDLTQLFEAAFNEQRVQRCLVRAGPQAFTTEVGGKKTGHVH